MLVAYDDVVAIPNILEKHNFLKTFQYCGDSVQRVETIFRTDGSRSNQKAVHFADKHLRSAFQSGGMGTSVRRTTDIMKLQKHEAMKEFCLY